MHDADSGSARLRTARTAFPQQLNDLGHGDVEDPSYRRTRAREPMHQLCGWLSVASCCSRELIAQCIQENQRRVMPMTDTLVRSDGKNRQTRLPEAPICNGFARPMFSVQNNTDRKSSRKLIKTLRGPGSPGQ